MEARKGIQSPVMGAFALGAVLHLSHAAPTVGFFIMAGAFTVAFGYAIAKRRMSLKGFVIGTVILVAFGGPIVGYFLQESSPDKLRNEAQYASTLCPDYYTWNFFQQWNSSRGWCRNYPQYDPANAAKAAQMVAEPVASTTTNKLWK